MPIVQYSIWTGADTPSSSSNEAVALNLGTRFKTDIAGNITAIKFYKKAGATNAFTVALWTNDGTTMLGSGTRSGDSTEGWVTVNLTTPVVVSTGTYYVASIHSASFGEYGFTSNYFEDSGRYREPLYASQQGENGFPNGLFKYAAFSFPTEGFNGVNYFVDVVLEADSNAGSTPTPPSVRSRSEVTYASRTNTTLDKPAGTLAGDLMICLMSVGGTGAPPIITPPSGWTELTGTGFPNQVTNGGGFNLDTKAYYKFAGSSEPSSYTFTHAARQTGLYCAAIQNALAEIAPTIVATDQTEFYTPWSADTGRPPAITAVDPNSLILAWADAFTNYTAGTPLPVGGIFAPVEDYFSANTLIYVARGVKKSASSTGRPRIYVSAAPAATGLIAIRPSVTGAPQTITPTGIASAEAFGTPTVTPGTVTITPNGIPSEEVFGSLTVIPGAVIVLPTGIPSAVAFGVALITSIASIFPTGIPSSEAFGTPLIIPGAVTILPFGIPSAEAFGIAIISGGTAIVAFSIDEKVYVIPWDDDKTLPVDFFNDKTFTLRNGMAILNGTISPTGIGAHRRIVRTYKIPVGVSFVKAWLTIKSRETEPDPGLIQKDITPTLNPTKGHIEDFNSDTGQIKMFFELLESETDDAKPNKIYVYGIEGERDNGERHPLEQGKTSFFRIIKSTAP